MGNVGESTWRGFIGSRDNTPVRRLTRNPFKTNPGGITGIWGRRTRATRCGLRCSDVRRSRPAGRRSLVELQRGQLARYAIVVRTDRHVAQARRGRDRELRRVIESRIEERALDAAEA
jgi:hypothetical protein